jgi:CheY-like chemotaxis protein
LVGDGRRQKAAGGGSEDRASGPNVDLANELTRLRALARDSNTPLGTVIANLGFAMAEVASLAKEIAGSSGAAPDAADARTARLRRALAAVTEALTEARGGAERLREIHRDLLDGGAAHGHAGIDLESGSRRAAAPSNSQRSRVMVVDDEPMIVRAIQRLLEGEHEVVMCTDPSEAIAQLGAGDRFQVILCDLMMPTMSGIDVFKAVRNLDADQARRMVFMTGGAFSPHVIEFLDSIENAKIDKPLERSALRDAIRRTIDS